MWLIYNYLMVIYVYVGIFLNFFRVFVDNLIIDINSFVNKLKNLFD